MINYERIPERTIFIRDNPTFIDGNYKKPKCIAIKSTFEDKGVISTLPGAVWRGSVREWWVDTAHIEEVAKVLPHYRMHSTALACFEEAQEKNLDARQAWQEFNEQVSKEMPEYLFEHQKRVVHWADQLDTGALFMDTGTGKTLTALEIAKRKIEAGKVHRWLVVCPLSLVRTVWMKESARWHPELKVTSLWRHIGGSVPALQRALSPNEDQIQVVNFETFRQIHKQLIAAQNSKRPLYDGIIVDESSIMKNQSSKITQALLDFSKTCATRFILSGCPAPNTPLEYFSQLKFIDPEVLGMSFMSFRDRWFTAVWGGTDKWSISDEKLHEMMERIRSVAVFVKKSECLDLPEQTLVTREVQMNAKQARVYTELVTALASAIDPTLAVIAPNQLARAMKLRQVTSGFIIPTELIEDMEDARDEAELDAVLKSLGIRPYAEGEERIESSLISKKKMPPEVLSMNKCEAIVELLTDELHDHQVIVWCQFIHEFHQLQEMFKAAGITFECLYGEQDKKKYSQIDEDFIAGKFRVLICHPRSVAHGHTWVNASYNIWMSISYSYEEFRQGRDRIHRHGQTKPCTDIVMTSVLPDGHQTIDHVLVGVLENKGNLAEAVTNYFRGEDEE